MRSLAVFGNFIFVHLVPYYPAVLVLTNTIMPTRLQRLLPPLSSTRYGIFDSSTENNSRSKIYNEKNQSSFSPSSSLTFNKSQTSRRNFSTATTFLPDNNVSGITFESAHVRLYNTQSLTDSSISSLVNSIPTTGQPSAN